MKKGKRSERCTKSTTGIVWFARKPDFHRKIPEHSPVITTQFSQKCLVLRKRKQTKALGCATLLKQAAIAAHSTIVQTSLQKEVTETLSRKGIYCTFLLLDDCLYFRLQFYRWGMRTINMVLTFIIVILFWPISCHEATQSSAAHVPTARPFIDLEQPRMIAKRLWRVIFRDWWDKMTSVRGLYMDRDAGLPFRMARIHSVRSLSVGETR